MMSMTAETYKVTNYDVTDHIILRDFLSNPGTWALNSLTSYPSLAHLTSAKDILLVLHRFSC